MSTDIIVFGEKKNSKGMYEQVLDCPKLIQSYRLFGWLADIRNISAIKPLEGVIKWSESHIDEVEPISERVQHEYTYKPDYSQLFSVSIEILNSVDYTKIINDRRHHGITLPEAEGTKLPLSEFLGEEYFEFLKEVNNRGIERIVFWFD